MANLQVRDIDDKLYKFLKNTAKLNNRSVSQEVTTMIKAWLLRNDRDRQNADDAFLELAGTWQDDRDAEEIINSLRNARNKSRRFGEEHAFSD